MNKTLKYFFFALVVKPLVYVILGLNVRNGDKLPQNGPVILVANHSSHIDTLILMSLFKLKTVLTIYPIAAKDYFLKTKFRSWFFLNVIGIIPIERNAKKVTRTNPFEGATQLLKSGNIVIVFPEGTRSITDELGEFKKGVALFAKLNPEVPVIPIYMNGPGKVLPKGASFLVPFICDVYIGDELYWNENTDEFMKVLRNSIEKLSIQHNLKTS